MALLDRVIFNPAQDGAADFTVASAVKGYQTPSQANAVNGSTYHYAAEIRNSAGTVIDWEVGTGTWTSATNTLARTSVLFSSNSGSKVNFSNPPQVMITMLAEDLGPIGLGTGTDTCILFDKAGVVGEDTNLEWDYTNKILHNDATSGIIQTQWHYAKGASGTGPALYAFLSTENPNLGARFSAGLDANNIPYCGFGPGAAAQDTVLYRTAAYTLAVAVTDTFHNSNGAGFQVYNKWDYIAENFVSNYERGVFDWTSRQNVLSIGTQNAGTGSVRNIEILVGGINVLDYGVTTANTWTVAAGKNLNSFYINIIGTTGTFPGIFSRLDTDTSSRFTLGLDGSDRPNISFGPGGSASQDTTLYRPAAYTLGFVGTDPFSFSSHPAAFQVYNSTDSTFTNYERGVFDWTTTVNVLTIGTQASGSGTGRQVNLVSAGGVIKILSTAGQNDVFRIDGSAAGSTGYCNFWMSGDARTYQIGLGNSAESSFSVANKFFIYEQNAGTMRFVVDGPNNLIQVGSGAVIGWSSGSGAGAAADTGLSRIAPVSSVPTISIGNGTAADASGTIKAKTKAGAPTTSDVPSGTWVLIRDTTNNTTKMYYNNAGTLQTVALV